ncbi:hypothetical protein AB1Y20_015592 [Prymnesium parvum]|uniref:Uncharacterized protein n=1 Tax=Prymnesium parvum TaxID=97485 RepID=A0AB34K1E0_PRYPA
MLWTSSASSCVPRSRAYATKVTNVTNHTSSARQTANGARVELSAAARAKAQAMVEALMGEADEPPAPARAPARARPFVPAGLAAPPRGPSCKRPAAAAAAARRARPFSAPRLVAPRAPPPPRLAAARRCGCASRTPLPERRCPNCCNACGGAHGPPGGGGRYAAIHRPGCPNDGDSFGGAVERRRA